MRLSSAFTIAVALALAVGVAGCTGATDGTDVGEDLPGEDVATPDPGTDDGPVVDPGEGDGDAPQTPDSLSWVDMELSDSVTGETFRISDFAGDPVLVQGFAVW